MSGELTGSASPAAPRRTAQLSVLATTTVHYCRSCDREVLAAYLATEAGRLVMPTELPTTSGDSD